MKFDGQSVCRQIIFGLLIAATALHAKESGPQKQDPLKKCVAQLEKSPSWRQPGRLSNKQYLELVDVCAAVRRDLPLLSYIQADQLLASLLRAANNQQSRKVLLSCFSSFVGEKSLVAARSLTGSSNLTAIAKAKFSEMQELRKELDRAAKLRKKPDLVTALLKIAAIKAPNAAFIRPPLSKSKGKDFADLESAVTDYLACRWDQEIGTKENSLRITYLIRRIFNENKTPMLNLSFETKRKRVFYELPVDPNGKICRFILPPGAPAKLLTKLHAVELTTYLMLAVKQAEEKKLQNDGWVGTFQSSSYFRKSMAAIQDDQSLNAWIRIVNSLITDDFTVPEAARKKDFEIGPKAATRMNVFVQLVKKHKDPNKVHALAKELETALL